MLEVGLTHGAYSRYARGETVRDGMGRLHQEYQGSTLNREFFMEDGRMLNTLNPRRISTPIVEPVCENCDEPCVHNLDGEPRYAVREASEDSDETPVEIRDNCPLKQGFTNEVWLPPVKEGLWQAAPNEWVCELRIPFLFIDMMARWPITIRRAWTIKEAIRLICDKDPRRWKRKRYAQTIKHNLTKLRPRSREEYDSDFATKSFVTRWIENTLNDMLPVSHFYWNGIWARVLPGREQFYAKEIRKISPGIALCACSDGIEREIPVAALMKPEPIMAKEEKIEFTMRPRNQAPAYMRELVYALDEYSKIMMYGKIKPKWANEEASTKRLDKACQDVLNLPERLRTRGYEDTLKLADIWSNKLKGAI